MAFVELTGLAPDLDPVTPGILVDAVNIVPGVRGIKAAPTIQSQGIAALADVCLGGALVRLLDNTTRLIAGIDTALYELNGTSWTDVTRTVGGAYTAGSENRWRFAQFRNVTLAAIKSDTIQFSSSGAFANTATAPKAAIIETVGSFVFAFDTNEATYGDSQDRWWCAALDTYDNWTPAIATQSATNRLTSVPGPITAGKRLGQYMVVYKLRGIYLGTYVGGDIIWSFPEVSSDVGAVSQEAVVNVETRHYFMGADDFYSYDGANVVSIGQDIREWWVGRVNKTYRHLSAALHDRGNGLIYWFYPTSTSALDSAVVYNYRSGRWGTVTLTVEALLQYVEAGVTYDGLGALYSTYDDLPTDIAYDSQTWVAGSPTLAAIDSAHTLGTLNGNPGSWSFTTGDYGGEGSDTLVSRVQARYITRPTGVLYQHGYREAIDQSITLLDSVAELNLRHDVLWTAKWHRGTLSGSGAMEITGVDFVAGTAGRT